MEDRPATAIINVLMRLDREANAEGVDAMTFARKARAIQNILEVVEHDYGEDALVLVVVTATRRLGHRLGPLYANVVEKLVARGCVITKTRRGTNDWAETILMSSLCEARDKLTYLRRLV